MLYLYFVKIIRRISKFLEKLIVPHFQHKSLIDLFPLSKIGSIYIPNTKAIYFRKFQSIAQSVEGMTSDNEAGLLLFLNSTQIIKGDTVEIGSWLGKSTIYLAMASKISQNGLVHAVDTFKGNTGKESLYTSKIKESETIFSTFKKNIKLEKLNNHIKIHKMTSVEAAKKIKNKIRFVFIDGCHEYQAVYEDIYLWSKKISIGGLIVLDDFNIMFPGVIRATQELIINNDNFKVIMTYDSFFVAQKIK